jgi:hypothetical protein
MGLLSFAILTGCTTERESQIDYLGQDPPNTSAEVFAPGIISTDGFEHSSPAFSPDGNVVLWTVVSKKYRASLMEMKKESGKWTKPQRPSFADSTADDYYPSFSPDGKRLYFSSRRKLPDANANGDDIRIWMVDRNANGWGIPVPFDTIVSRGGDYAHSTTTDGTIYFSSSLGGGTNWNIRKAEIIDGTYIKPEQLPYSINSVGYEEGPCIAADESFLIFESQRPESIDGGLDLYISFRTKDDHWSIPLNMGPKINSRSSERFARVSPNGKYLFFGSNRDQSIGRWGFDIYWIDAEVINELRRDSSSQVAIENPLGDEVIDALFRNDYVHSGTLLESWLNYHPNSLDAIIIYSAVLRRQKRFEEAQRLLTTTKTSRWSNNASVLMELALVKYGMHRKDEAEKLLAPILLEGDQLREQYISISFSLLDMGNLKASEGYFEKAMAIFPSSFPYHRRACALARAGEKDKAFEALNKAVDHGGLTSKKDYENNGDLQSLRSDARWKALLMRLQ